MWMEQNKSRVGPFVSPFVIYIQMIHLYDLFNWSIQIFVIVCLSIHIAHLDESSKWILCLFLYFHFHSNEFSKQITKIPLCWFNHMFDINFNYIFLCYGREMYFGCWRENIFFCDLCMKTCFSVFAGKHVFAILTGKYFFAILAGKCVLGFWREKIVFSTGKSVCSFVSFRLWQKWFYF